MPINKHILEETGVPEYLLLGEDYGNYTLKLKNSTKILGPTFKATANILHYLIDPETGNYYQNITYDEFPFELRAIEINTIKMEITIKIS